MTSTLDQHAAQERALGAALAFHADFDALIRAHRDHVSANAIRQVIRVRLDCLLNPAAVSEAAPSPTPSEQASEPEVEPELVPVARRGRGRTAIGPEAACQLRTRVFDQEFLNVYHAAQAFTCSPAAVIDQLWFRNYADCCPTHAPLREEAHRWVRNREAAYADRGNAELALYRVPYNRIVSVVFGLASDWGVISRAGEQANYERAMDHLHAVLRERETGKPV